MFPLIRVYRSTPLLPRTIQNGKANSNINKKCVNKSSEPNLPYCYTIVTPWLHRFCPSAIVAVANDKAITPALPICSILENTRNVFETKEPEAEITIIVIVVARNSGIGNYTVRAAVPEIRDLAFSFNKSICFIFQGKKRRRKKGK